MKKYLGIVLILFFCVNVFGASTSDNKYRIKGRDASQDIELILGDGTNSIVVPSGGGNLRFSDDSGSTFTEFVSLGANSSGTIENSTVDTGVSANALTIDLTVSDGSTDPSATNVSKISFRSPTVVNGAYNIRSVTGALGITITSGATLGHTDGDDGFIYVYALDNAGTVELAVSTSVQDESSIQTTTIMDVNSDSATGFFSTVARANVPIRLISRLKSNQVTAGTWALDVVENSPDSPLFTHFQTSKLSTPDLTGEYTSCFLEVTDAAGTPTITAHTNCVASVVDNSVGNETVNFISGTFSVDTFCNVVSNNSSFGRSCHLAGTSNTAAAIRCETSAGSAFAQNYMLICFGKK